MTKKELTKKQAPKQNGITPEEKKVTPMNVGPAPQPIAAKSEKDIVAENKAIKKAEKKAKKDEKVLHFSFLKFILNLAFFIASTVMLVMGTMVLLNHGVSATKPVLDYDIVVYIDLVLILSFAVWMSTFQLGFRRVFGIGKYERIRKAQDKKQNNN